MAESFDLEELVHLEQTFYDVGYADGYSHGRVHGLIEGRALGRSKGFEIWEEIGFYEGFAQTWAAVYAQRDQTDHRALHHIAHLLDLIRRFPTVNPSADDRDLGQSQGPSSASSPSSEDVSDLSRLQSQIRSRYKALCASLGVRPPLRACALANEGTPDASKTRDVWTLEGDVRRPTIQGLSF